MIHSLIKSCFLVCNIFNLIPPLLKMKINSKNNLLFFTKECHLLSDKLESMKIQTPSGYNDKPEGVSMGQSQGTIQNFVKKNYQKPENFRIFFGKRNAKLLNFRGKFSSFCWKPQSIHIFWSLSTLPVQMKYFLRHLVPGVKGTSQMEEVHRLRAKEQTFS